MSASTASSTRNKHSKENEKLDITQDEFDRIRQALSQEEFRKLFFDYVEEIQDPENRKIYEQEITQLEKERGVAVTFIHPKPGFVIKTAIDGDLKCFINIASSPEIARPRNELARHPETGDRGLNWSIPMAQTSSRDDCDAKNKYCKVFDVVFHPDALYLSQRNKQFRKCLIDTALDAVEREYQVCLDRANLKFPKLDYKGITRPTVIRKLDTNATPEEQEPHPLEHLYPKKPDATAGQPKVLPVKTNVTPKPQFAVPKYSIKQSHDVDLSEYTNELDAKLHVTMPRKLIVEIELPLLRSTAECQLDVTSKSIYLLSERHGAKYKLKLDLPYTVDDKAGNARFDTDCRRLCITLPVVRTNKDQQRNMHDTLRHFSREDSGVELHSNSESPAEEDVNDEADSSDSTGEQSKQVLANAPNVTITHPFLKSSRHYQLPAKFDCNVFENTLTFVLHVANVQPDSVSILKQSQSVHVQFATLGSGYYPTYYAFYMELPSELDADLCIESAEAEAWDNNVIVKLDLKSVCAKLQSYLAGLDSNNLKEYAIYGHLIGKPKVQPRTVTLDIDAQRNEADDEVNIKIKPQLTVVNTTEDDEPRDLQETQQQAKKLNKKQRKRNKKQRSLSESTYEDIKAYDAKQLTKADEDSSPERNDAATNSSSSQPMAMATLKPPQRKQRSYSECNDRSVGSGGSYKGILKRLSRYGPRPSISDSCSSIDECSSSFSCSIDAGNFSQSFGGIPEERDDAGLSESCKKTVTFNDHIMKQVFRLDSSILGQRKKNQKRRDLKLRAQQRRLSEGDSGDYEDNDNHTLKTAANALFFKQTNDVKNNKDNEKQVSLHDSGVDLAGHKNSNNNKNNDMKAKRNKKPRAQHEADIDAKNSMIFEMDDDI